MNDMLNKNIHKSVSEMARFCGDSDIFSKDKEGKLPSRDVVTEILKDLRKVVFPGYFGDETLDSYAHFAEKMLGSVSEKLCSQISRHRRRGRRQESGGNLHKVYFRTSGNSEAA